jgi:hypothetical protein
MHDRDPERDCEAEQQDQGVKAILVVHAGLTF